MCVLDFYVHESRQRMGCGRRLFDFMLKVSAYSSPFTFFSQFATTFTTDDYCVPWGVGGLLFLEAQESEKTGKELENECCQKLVLSETYKICGICDHESAVQISFLSHVV